jgi:adenylylsulfate kinase
MGLFLKRKILIMGLLGAGKTTLARLLALRLGAVLFNADEVGANICRDLRSSYRTASNRFVAWGLSERVVEAGGTAIAEFVCPSPETRAPFG